MNRDRSEKSADRASFTARLCPLQSLQREAVHGQKSPDAPLDKQSPAVAPQTLLVYKARLDGIDFIKKQQWVVTNSVALIYAAIVWVGRNPSHPSPLLLWFLSVAIILAGLIAMGLLDRFKHDLNEAKDSLNKANEYCFTDDQRKALDLQKSEPHRGWEVFAAHLTVCTVGAFIAVVALWAQPR